MSPAHRSELGSAWSVLSPPRDQELSAFPLSNVPGADVRAGIDQLGRRHLLIAGDSPVEAQLLTGVLAVQLRTLAFSGIARRYLDVCCTDRELNAEFHEVAADVLEAVDRGTDPVADAVEVIERWRRLLRASALAALRENERLGLFAELSVLEALNRYGSGAPAAQWTGPLRASHDFELDTVCLEVKAIGRDSATVTVHGLQQLDLHDDRPLHLLLATVLPDEDGTSILELVRRLRGLHGDDRDLGPRLAAARIDLTEPQLAANKYTLASLFVHAVDASTPRIVASRFADGHAPAGVDRVRYEIDVAELLSRSRGVRLDDPNGWWSA